MKDECPTLLLCEFVAGVGFVFAFRMAFWVVVVGFLFSGGTPTTQGPVSYPTPAHETAQHAEAFCTGRHGLKEASACWGQLVKAGSPT